MDTRRDEYPTSLANAYHLFAKTNNDFLGRNLAGGNHRHTGETPMMFTRQQQQRSNGDAIFVTGTNGRVLLNIECWNCRDPGHTAQFCPLPPTGNSNCQGR